MSDSNLPAHWVTCPTSDVATLIRGVTYGKQDARKSEAKGFRPILRANNINGIINFDDLVFLPTQLISPAQQLRTGDILFAMSSGSRHLVGKSARITRDLDTGFGAFCGVLRPCDEVSDEYLFLVYQTRDFRRAVSEVSKGSNINNLKREHLLDYEIPLPPLAEQKRIVAKIEELFSELDAGEESLRQARRQLGVYRQSLLKQAFEGKLTAPWRNQNPHLLESPDQLLNRIQEERQARYEQQLKEWEVAVEKWEADGEEGRKMPKPSLPGKIARRPSDEAHTVPDQWLWMNLGDVSDVSGGLTKNSKRDSFELRIPYLRVANVYANELRLDEIKDIGVTSAEARKVCLEKGDLLIVEGNGSLDQIGRVAAWNGSISGCGHQNHLIRARCFPSANYSFVLMFLISPQGRDRIERQAASTSGLHTLSVSKVLGLSAPLCSLPEQQEIVRLLDEQFTVIEQNERELDAALKRSAALRQSILKKAFTGQLVPQDPTDEPAATLLQRIREERATHSAPKKTAKKIAAARSLRKG